MSVKYDGGKIKNMRMFKGLIRHCAPDTRYGDNQKNEHVDESKAGLNYSFLDLTYADRVERLQNRLKALESTNTNKRKDRVFAYSVEIAAPAELKLDQAKEWFKNTMYHMCAMYGYKDFSNLIYADLHCDEVHDYIGPGNEKRTSRIHAHLCFVPEKDGSLNAKWFSSKSNMQKANRVMDNMCREKGYGTFLTGAKTRSRKTVSELKFESVERLEEKYADLDTQMRSKIDEKASLDAEVKKYSDEHEKRLKNDSERSERLNSAIDELKSAMERYVDTPVNVTVQATDEDMLEFMKHRTRHNGTTMYEDFLTYKAEKVKKAREKALQADKERIQEAQRLAEKEAERLREEKKAEAERLRKERAAKEKRQQRNAEIALMIDRWKDEGYEMGY